ncbi:unnamed protein product [Candidula unifasciata]|uniref:SH2 domain-containing protein n=1 Tax=Candidula unifasciata TaxID=100452 RepID=A0A8S3Z0K5_9EUPU|nr:unnamed protein product [Candidula unifasciata]
MSRPRNIPDYPDEIISLPMFHPDMSHRHQAEAYVLQHNKGEGSYLVRPNTDNDPSYVSITISIVGNRTCNAKVFIENTNYGTRYFISDKLKFPTFNALLSYYCEHRIHCRQGINVRLMLPLRKINQSGQKIPMNGVVEAQQASSSSSGSDETMKGLKQPSKEDIHSKKREKYKIRANSESNMQVGQPASAITKKQGLFTSLSHGDNKASLSLSLPQMDNVPLPSHTNSGLKYYNLTSAKPDPKSFMKCRPPAPLPRPESQSSEDTFYYTSIDANKDFFHETYQFLKANEMCECGLRICDSELALGWTIHRSQDPATLNHIFFQHGESTTWDMPIELVDKLTNEQAMFIIYLCREGKQRVPVCLREMLDRMLGRTTVDRR